MTPTHPKFPNFVWDLEGAQKCFIPRDQTTGDLKSHHLQAPVTLTALSVPPRPPFLSAELWVIRYHISNLSQLCITIYIYSQYHIMHKKSFLRAPTASSGGGGGGGGGHVPPRPPPPPPPHLGPALRSIINPTVTKLWIYSIVLTLVIKKIYLKTLDII